MDKATTFSCLNLVKWTQNLMSPDTPKTLGCPPLACCTLQVIDSNPNSSGQESCCCNWLIGRCTITIHKVVSAVHRCATLMHSIYLTTAVAVAFCKINKVVNSRSNCVRQGSLAFGCVHASRWHEVKGCYTAPLTGAFPVLPACNA